MWAQDLGDLDAVIERALAEDLAAGDVTSRTTIGANVTARAELVAKAPVVVAGLAVAERTFTLVDPGRLVFTPRVSDGTLVQRGAVLAEIRGSARALLGAERTALNFLQRSSGIATLCRRYVDAAAGRCRVVDTRKTTPGLRTLERHAVRCGGGHNHRNDLGAGVLIKENHIRCAGGVAEAIRAARAGAPHTLRIECEVTTLTELRTAIAAGADAVLLDNMSDDEIAASVALVAGRALVEVSGGITLERMPRLAALGVDIVSVGALTHSAPAADISLLVDVDSVTREDAADGPSTP